MNAAGSHVWANALVSVLVLLLGCADRSPDEVQSLSAEEEPPSEGPALQGGAASPTSDTAQPAAAADGGVAQSEGPGSPTDASAGESTEDPGNFIDAGMASVDADAARELPNTVTVEGVHSGTDSAATVAEGGRCFLGFRAAVADLQLEFHAFVQEPGRYQGDPVHALYVNAITADGRSFLVNTLTSSPGEIELNVTTVSPRFAGHMTATLFDELTPDAPPLELSITFDIGGVEVCTG
jgi:hypothetical protein